MDHFVGEGPTNKSVITDSLAFKTLSAKSPKGSELASRGVIFLRLTSFISRLARANMMDSYHFLTKMLAY
jgi:hypothetical protein